METKYFVRVVSQYQFYELRSEDFILACRISVHIL